MAQLIVALSLLIFFNLHVQAQNNCNETLLTPVLTNPCLLPLLTVTYGNENVVCDENKPVTTYHSQPKVSFPEAIQGKNYTIVMSDPDTPVGTYLHWIVSDINALQLQQGELGNTADILAAYVPPSPPNGTGIHRYQFILAEQIPGLDVILELPPGGFRGNFQVYKFLNENQLCTVVAGVQFRTQFAGKRHN